LETILEKSPLMKKDNPEIGAKIMLDWTDLS